MLFLFGNNNLLVTVIKERFRKTDSRRKRNIFYSHVRDRQQFPYGHRSVSTKKNYHYSLWLVLVVSFIDLLRKGSRRLLYVPVHVLEGFPVYLTVEMKTFHGVCPGDTFGVRDRSVEGSPSSAGVVTIRTESLGPLPFVLRSFPPSFYPSGSWTFRRDTDYGTIIYFEPTH